MNPGRRTLWILLAILAVALTMRVARFHEIRGAAFIVSPVIDAADFQDMAERLAAGRLVGETAFQKAPLYPHLLALVYGIAGVRIPVAIAMQLLAGVVLCFLVFLLGRRLFDSGTGLVAAAFAAVYRPFIAFEGQLLAAWLAVLLTTVYLLVQEWASRRGGLGRWLSAGTTLGLAILVRGNLLFLVPFGPVWIAFSRQPTRRRARVAAAAVFLLGVILPVVPSALHNYLAEGVLVPLTSTAGINLYTGNRPGADGFSAIPVHSRWEAAMETAWDAERGTTAMRDRYWLDETFRTVASNPGAVTALWIKKAVLFWDGFEYPNNLSFAFLQQGSLILRLPSPGFGLLAPLALAGLFLLRREATRSVSFLGLFLLLYTLSVVPFFACDRYRLPAVPAILCLAAAVVVWSFRRVRARELRAAGRAAALVAALAVGVNVDLYGSRPDHVARDWVAVGDAFRFADRCPQAVRAYRQASAEDPSDPDGHALAGVCLLRMGQRAEAEQSLSEALRLDPRYTRPRVFLARLLFEDGRMEEAVKHLRVLAERYPEQVDPRILLGQAYLRLGRPRDAETRFSEALALDPESTAAREGLAEAARAP